jgi:TRAP-type C4-dicarboxylate transport system permease small subunit
MTAMVAGAFLAFLMVGTTLDVLSRYFIGSSIPGVFELAEQSMAILVFFGLGWTQIQRKHIRVTFAVDALPEPARRLAAAIAWLLSMLLVVYIAVPATHEAYHSTINQEFRWGVVQMPIWWVKIIAAIGLWLAGLQFLKNAVDALRRGDHADVGPAGT